MTPEAVTVLAAHDYAHRLQHGATNRSAALLDRLMLDTDISLLWSIARVHPRKLWNRSRLRFPGFARTILHAGPWGVLARIERHAGHAVQRRYLLEHHYPYTLDSRLLRRLEGFFKEFGGPGHVLTFTPKEAHVAKNLTAGKRLFDTNDDWLLSPLMAKRARHIRQGYEIAAEMDTVFVTNPRLLEKYPDHPDVRLVPNAGHGTIPETGRSFVKRERKHVVVAGYYHPERLDLEAFEEVLQAFPQVIFDVYGSLDGRIIARRLLGFPNLEFHGKVHVSRLRAELALADAALIPHPVTPYTLAQDMIKLYDMLGAGLPVVCPPIPPADCAGDLVYLVKNRNDYVSRLRQALSERDTEAVIRRREWSARNDWDARYRNLKQWLDE